MYVTNVVLLKGFYMTTLTIKDEITRDEILKVIEDKWLLMIKEAVLAEREACAIACETDGRDLAGLYYAGVIRARGEAT